MSLTSIPARTFYEVVSNSFQPTPDAQLSVTGVADSITSIAFDQGGNLWLVEAAAANTLTALAMISSGHSHGRRWQLQRDARSHVGCNKHAVADISRVGPGSVESSAGQRPPSHTCTRHVAYHSSQCSEAVTVHAAGDGLTQM